MSCLNLEVIERYAAGALGSAERAVADSHFASCERCREQLAQVQDKLRAAEQIARARAEGAGAAAPLAGMWAEKPLLNAVWPVVTGVMSAATSPSAARFALVRRGG